MPARNSQRAAGLPAPEAPNETNSARAADQAEQPGDEIEPGDLAALEAEEAGHLGGRVAG